MKKIIFLLGFILLWVFPPIAWDQNQNYENYGSGSAEFMRRMEQQANDQKNQNEKQQSQNKTEGLNQKQFSKGQEKKAQEGQQKQETDSGNDKTNDKN